MSKLSLKSKILLGALLLGSGVATGQAVTNAVTNNQVYTWAHLDRNGNPLGSFTGTISYAKSLTGCDSSGPVCATGTAAGVDTEEIRYTP